MKYVIIDNCGTDIFTKECETKVIAMKTAMHDFNHLTKEDKKKRKEFYILESFNSDPEAVDHLDGEVIFRFIGGIRNEINDDNI